MLLVIKTFMVEVIQRFQLNNDSVDIPLEKKKIDAEEFRFINTFRELFNHFYGYNDVFRPDHEFTKHMDWSTKAVGSFFIKNLENIKDRCSVGKDFNLELHQSFTLPGQNLSAPHIAALYSANDFRALAIDKDIDVDFSTMMESCIKEVKSVTFDNHDMELFLEDEVNPLLYIEVSPCLNNNDTRYQSCNSYCKWHNTYFKDLPKNEFLNMMKYAVPQRKPLLSSTQFEQDYAKKMFGKESTGKLNHKFAPFALILFCYKRSEGLVGEDIGPFAKLCNDFFPTPTDHGICLTQNMDINQVMKIGKEYENLFEADLQKPPESVKGGTYGSKHTLVFFSGVFKKSYGYKGNPTGGDSMDQMDVRDLKKDTGDVRLEFNQANQIPHIIEDANYRSSSSLKLKCGYEYVIDVQPKVIQTSLAFKEMNLEQRKCKLSHEVEETSIFKVYTQQNCRYECNVKEAESLCKCIPWDFINQNTLAKECDIFGRTCFFNVMENISKSNNFCNHCIKECDYAIYDGIITQETQTMMKPYWYQSSCYRDKALKVFCDYFWSNNNGTNITDNGLDNSYNAIRREGYNQFMGKHAGMSQDLIIVHWRIRKPEIKVIDAKYSTLDKFANFGGNFGIFAEITGCSFLGMVNFLILLFKLIFFLHMVKIKLKI